MPAVTASYGKKPISTEIIRCILDMLNKREANLENLRIATLRSLAFAGFFRYNELSLLSILSFTIRIFVPSSKTDV